MKVCMWFFLLFRMIYLFIILCKCCVRVCFCWHICFQRKYIPKLHLFLLCYNFTAQRFKIFTNTWIWSRFSFFFLLSFTYVSIHFIIFCQKKLHVMFLDHSNSNIKCKINIVGVWQKKNKSSLSWRLFKDEAKLFYWMSLTHTQF